MPVSTPEHLVILRLMCIARLAAWWSALTTTESTRCSQGSDGGFWRRTTSHSAEIKQKNTQQLVGVVVLVQDQLIISANMMVRELPPSAFAGCEELHNHFRQT